MTASPGKAVRHFSYAVVVALGLVLNTEADAQIVESPGFGSSGEAQDFEGQASVEAPGATPPQSLSAPAPLDTTPVTGAPVGVMQETLQEITADGAGVLTLEAGGFGSELWLGTERSVVEALLPKLPVSARSRVMRDMMRRLLLTLAPPPVGPGEDNALIIARAALLADLGDNKAFNDLLQAVPNRTEISGLALIEAQHLFLTGDNARACAATQVQIERDRDIFWEKALIFCQLLSGDISKARLGVSLMQELGDQDAIFFKLVEAIGGQEGITLEGLTNPTALHLAMARVAGLGLPITVIGDHPPAILRAIAINPKAELAVRLAAAEAAEANGAFDTNTLLELYTALPAEAPEKVEATADGEEAQSPSPAELAAESAANRGRAYQKAVRAQSDMARAEVISEALYQALAEGRYGTAARVFAPVINRVPPSKEMAWFAPAAVRAFLATGQPGLANAWMVNLRAQAMFDPTLATQAGAVMPLAVYVNHPLAQDWLQAAFPTWWPTVATRPEAASALPQMLGILHIAGRTVPSEAWGAVIGAGSGSDVAMPNPAVWFRLDEAANAGRLGETIILSLALLGNGGPEANDALVLGRAMGALRALGLETEAFDLGLEAMASRGF